jgi:hypothetical protein
LSISGLLVPARVDETLRFVDEIERSPPFLYFADADARLVWPKRLNI